MLSICAVAHTQTLKYCTHVSIDGSGGSGSSGGDSEYTDDDDDNVEEDDSNGNKNIDKTLIAECIKVYHTKQHIIYVLSAYATNAQQRVF